MAEPPTVASVVIAQMVEPNDARLIAAAPELLEACQWFITQLDDSVLVRDISNDGDPDYHIRMLKFVAALGKASDAIAKAEALPVKVNEGAL